MGALQQLRLAAVGGGATLRSQLLFGGADGSTVFTDTTGKVWTPFGNAQIDTSLGDQRGLFDGSGDYIKTPDHADLNMGTGDFTIAFRLRFNSIAGFQTVASRGYTINANGAWLLQTGNGNGIITFYTTAGGTTFARCSSSALSAGVDYDIEVRRASGTVTFKVNGATTGSGADPTNLSVVAETSIGGGSSTGYNNFWFNGWVSNWSIA